MAGWPLYLMGMSIVERLRRQIATKNGNHLLCYEAADEIERLRARIERQQAARQDEEATMRDEIRRLRGLLRTAYDSMTAAGVRGGLDDIRNAL